MSQRSTAYLMVSLALLAGATSALADNDLTVNTDAAIVGVYGLEVLVDGSPNAAFAATTEPDNETTFRAEFRIRHNNVAMANGTGHLLMIGRRGDPVINNIRVFVKRLSDQYKVTARVKKDGAGTANCGKLTLGSLGARIGIEWLAATAEGAGDGVCRLLRNGVVQFETTGLDNDTMEVDAIRFGAPQGVALTTVGSYYLDDFSSFRTLAP